MSESDRSVAEDLSRFHSPIRWRMPQGRCLLRSGLAPHFMRVRKYFEPNNIGYLPSKLAHLLHQPLAKRTPRDYPLDAFICLLGRRHSSGSRHLHRANLHKPHFPPVTLELSYHFFNGLARRFTVGRIEYWLRRPWLACFWET